MSGNLSAEISRRARQSLGAPEQSLGLAKSLLALLELLLQTQEGSGIFEQTTATLPACCKPA